MLESNRLSTTLYEKNDNGPVLYIRHAESCYNNYTKNISPLEIEYETQHWDSPISDTGIQQAEQLGTKLAEYSIKYVFCSPLRRCMQTALISLSKHPQNDIKIFIHPYLTECVHVFHDYSCNVKEKKTEFSKEKTNLPNGLDFDWSYLEEIFPNENDQEAYYINLAENFTQEETEIMEVIDAIKKEPLNVNLIAKFNSYFLDHHKRPESLKQVFRRNLKFKQFLKEFIGNATFDANEKVLVFTHSDYTKMATSQQAYSMDVIEDFPEDRYFFANCEIITMNI